MAVLVMMIKGGTITSIFYSVRLLHELERQPKTAKPLRYRTQSHFLINRRLACVKSDEDKNVKISNYDDFNEFQSN